MSPLPALPEDHLADLKGMTIPKFLQRVNSMDRKRQNKKSKTPVNNKELVCTEHMSRKLDLVCLEANKLNMTMVSLLAGAALEELESIIIARYQNA